MWLGTPLKPVLGRWGFPPFSNASACAPGECGGTPDWSLPLDKALRQVLWVQAGMVGVGVGVGMCVGWVEGCRGCRQGSACEHTHRCDVCFVCSSSDSPGHGPGHQALT